MTSNHYNALSTVRFFNHVPLNLAIMMTLRMTLRGHSEWHLQHEILGGYPRLPHLSTNSGQKMQPGMEWNPSCVSLFWSAWFSRCKLITLLLVSSSVTTPSTFVAKVEPGNGSSNTSVFSPASLSLQIAVTIKSKEKESKFYLGANVQMTSSGILWKAASLSGSEGANERLRVGGLRGYQWPGSQWWPLLTENSLRGWEESVSPRRSCANLHLEADLVFRTGLAQQ